MTENITTNIPRSNFVDFINKRLTDGGFIKDQENEIWAVEKDIHSGGRTIIVNGRRIDQPGELRSIKFIVEIFGEGEIKENDAVEPFIEINFYKEENKNK